MAKCNLWLFGAGLGVLTGFIAYARADLPLARQLRQELQTWEGEQIHFWMDEALAGGDDWDSVIRGQIGRSDVVLFLLTGNTFWSEYIWRREYPEAKRRKRKASWVAIVPITAELVLPMLVRRGDIGRWQSIPIPDRSIAACGSNDRWVANVSDQLRTVVTRVRELRHVG